MTKYDPRQRDLNGSFLGEDWTSISDIGKRFDGVVLTAQPYLHIENAYVQAVKALMSAAHVNSVRVTALETRGGAADALAKLVDDGVIERCSQIRSERIVSQDELQDVVRGCLREYIWCRVLGREGFYIHFGHDYYMYVGMPKRVKLPLLPPEIFIEEFDSPYLEDEEE